jgi:conjugative transposon TraM protein
VNMEKKERSGKFLRKRKLMLVLPLLVIPFLTIGFYALGGGSGAASKQGDNEAGLNIELPSAEVKEEVNATKLSFYEKAEALQKEKEKEIQNDPYFKLTDADELTVQEPDAEQKVLEKISMLEREINKPTTAQKESPGYYTRPVYNERMPVNVDRLEQMMRMMNEKNEDDPEIRQLDTMLEKIMDVQHPDRVKERLSAKTQEKKMPVFEVKYPDDLVRETKTGFFGTESNSVVDAAGKAIEAVVHETQTVLNGSVVKLRLVNDININRAIIPKDNFVYGIASLNGERINVEIESVRFQNSLFPVKMQAFDMDGLQGIYVPGSISRDAVLQSADNNLGLMEAGALDPSFKAQMMAAGIGTAKKLLSRKFKLVKVSVKAGYKLLLRNNNLQN